jgi:hypothetical protein
MDTPLYDVYLTGKLADNTTAAQAAQRLATMFKSTPEVMAGMLTGKPQLLKRGVDRNAALKYREALGNAGVEVAFKAQASAATTAMQPARGESTHTASVVTPTATLTLAPVGADVLQASERQHNATPNIDTSALQLAPLGPLPAVAPAPTVAPDTSYLSLAAVGGELLSAAEKQHPPVAIPNISDLTLAPAGTPLETLRSEVPPLQPDLNGLSLAPPGAELLTAEQRKKPVPAAPNTDHLTLAN